MVLLMSGIKNDEQPQTGPATEDAASLDDIRPTVTNNGTVNSTPAVEDGAKDTASAHDTIDNTHKDS